MERRIFILMAILLSFAITCSLGTMARADSNPLLKSLRKFDQNFCRSIPASCKARAKKRVKKGHVARKAKTAAKIESVEPSVDPKIKAPVEAPVKAPVVAPVVKATPKVEVQETPKLEVKATPKVDQPVEAAGFKPPIPRAKPIMTPAKPEKEVVIVLPPPLALPKVEVPQKPKGDMSDDACLQQLRALGAEFTSAANNVDSGLCHVYNPVHLNSIRAQKDVVKLPEAPLLNCKFALQFSKWVRESGAPILSAQMNSPLEKLATGPGFECRGRNGDASAKISEHGYGNAVDITTFRMRNGEVVNVAEAQNTAAASYSILRGLRASACGYFTTVLGPGSNEAHKTHFHFDIGAHGKTGNYRICE